VHRLTRIGIVAGLIAMGLPMAIGFGPSAGVVIAAPRIEIDPGSGAPGSSVTIAGSGFPREAKGRLLWADGTVLETFRTTRRGRFSARFDVPNTPPGTHPFTAHAGGVTRQASFEVTGADPGDPSPGPTYYVDGDDGDDANPGTSPATAWRTLAKASQAPLAPGDRLLFRRGGSWTGSLKLSRSGTSELPIVIGAYGSGDLPRIRDGSSCVVMSGSYLVLREIHADGCSWAGIQISGSANQVEQSLITRNVAGVQVRAGAADNRILRNVLRDNNRMSVLTRSPTDDDSGAFGVLLQGDGTVVAYNTISGSDAFSYDYGHDGAAVEVYGGQRNHIHHNLAIDNDAFSELGNARSSDNTFAYNVVRSSLPAAVFLVTRGANSGYGPVLRTTLYNNSVVLTGASSEGFVCHAGCGPDILTMRNNIIQAVRKVGYADAPFDEDHNLYFGGARQFAMGDRSLAGDPLFVDEAGGNLRLRSSSPAIDRGVDVGYANDIDGAPVPAPGGSDRPPAPDLGAYERQG
jgi:hypothetical protein